MPAAADHRPAIATALADFDARPLPEAARRLFAVLGYESDRQVPVNNAQEFCDSFDSNGSLTAREREQLGHLTALHFLFQLTDAELTSHSDLFDDAGSVDNTRILSYLFFAVELPAGTPTRTFLSGIARAINKPLPMPALVLMRYGDTLSLAILHRRLNKRAADKDVLEKATLIKDISLTDPIRAHLEILNDFALDHLDADFGAASFVSLHHAWQKRLGSYALSNDFYREIADWYFWAHHQVDDGTIRLPRDCDTEAERSLFLIRLLTRLIFCWFLVEKRLLPPGLFRRKDLAALLTGFSMEAPSFYQAVLQNLFFGTLNMPVEQRGFRAKKKDGERYDKNRGITNLWRYGVLFCDYDKADDLSAAWAALASKVPFLNGGLFDCLDDKTGRKPGKSILDGFSDNPNESCHLPNDIFFGEERTVDLSKDYGEEDKRTARSKKARVRGVVEILARYKFTIEENTPLEEEIALDPELLGKVFENLLASYNEDTRTTARKALGAFYTPREIVGYMVDEALRSYLATQVPAVPEKALRDLFSPKATPTGIKPAQQEALVAAIGRVKILDPACGSGAFPMGALHRLVDLLQKLDPNNESWKRDRLAEARRYRELLEEAGAAPEEIADCESRIADIEKSFNTRFHALDFARKLYLIENCIYGVDIQPIATQIAKLRFFISLIVDQKVDAATPNLGVRPLPNLETRLVAADTLIPIEQDSNAAAGDLFSGDIDRLRADLARIRHEHFNARDPRKKAKWREADAAKREELAKLLETEQGLDTEAAGKLAKWDPYDQNEHAPFFDTEWMFGIPVGKVRLEGKSPVTLRGNMAFINEADGQAELVADKVREFESGFDVVIGNPPYIRIQTLKLIDPNLVALLREQYVSAAKGNYDIYVVFIEAGMKLLKSDGQLAYICPHKFFNQQYGEGVRAFIANGNYLRHVVHFGDEQVFSGATIYTCLLFLTKAGSKELRFVRADDLESWKANKGGSEGIFSTDKITASEWNFSTGKDQAVFERLSEQNDRLENIAARIFQGLVTGADGVFILEKVGALSFYSSATQQTYELENELLHPLCKGSVDIRRYAIEPITKWILFPYDVEGGRAELISADQFVQRYPKAWHYLLANRDKLEARENGKWRHARWYAFGRSQNLNEMEQIKILTPSIASAASFTLDLAGTYYFPGSGGGGGGGYGITVRDEEQMPLKVLLGVLNSTSADFFLKKVSAPFANGYFAYNRQFIEQIPVPPIYGLQFAGVTRLVDYLLHSKGQFTRRPTDQITRDPLMLAYFEQILNGLVYELYFPDEVHTADLQLFDLVADANLPEINAIPEAQRLPKLRQLFEALYDGTHPLKIALQKLQTLDTVRIIEGKA